MIFFLLKYPFSFPLPPLSLVCFSNVKSQSNYTHHVAAHTRSSIVGHQLFFSISINLTCHSLFSMTFQRLLLGATALAFSEAAIVPLGARQSIGCAVITNLCSFPVYYANVPQMGYGADMFGVIPAGTSYRAQYDVPQIGHSIKLSLVEGSLSNILQFEYSQTLDGHVDYDVSQVNGNPFGSWGFSLDSEAGCPRVRCESPVDGCSGVYQDPTSDVNPNYYCPITSDTGVTLCSG